MLDPVAVHDSSFTIHLSPLELLAPEFCVFIFAFCPLPFDFAPPKGCGVSALKVASARHTSLPFSHQLSAIGLGRADHRGSKADC
jgi:hypothetical protein